MKHYVPVLRGLCYTIRITPQRGFGVVGTLEEDDEVIFEAEFMSYTDAYWSLMEMDSNDYIKKQNA